MRRKQAIRAAVVLTLVGLLTFIAGDGTFAPGSPGSAAEPICAGDCDGDQTVTVGELITGVNVLLGLLALEQCEAFDRNEDASVTVEELVTAINSALFGCTRTGPSPSRTPTPTVPPSSTPRVTPTVGDAPRVRIVEPRHGSFTDLEAVAILGVVENASPETLLTINGTAVPIAADGSFTTTVDLGREAIFNPILAEIGTGEGASAARDRVVVIAGRFIADGDLSPLGLAVRINESGFERIEALIPELLALDLDSIVPPGTELVSRFCAIDSPFGCLRRVDVTARSAQFESVAVDLDSMTDFLATEITVTDMSIAVNIEGGPIDCNARLTASETSISGDYELHPLALDPTRINVVQLGDPTVDLISFESRFTSGVCDFPLLGDLISLLVGNVKSRVRDGLRELLRDPDGAGPLDAPIAGAIERSLQSLDVADPIRNALGVNLHAPWIFLSEDDLGVTLAADASLTAVLPMPGSPDLAGSLHVEEPFPALGSMTPIGELPYDLAICLSTSALNQLFKAGTEGGFLSFEIREIDLGSGPVPLTASVLSLLIPELASVDPSTPLTVRVRPTLAPVLSGQSGPGSELLDFRIAHLLVELIAEGEGKPHLEAAVDFRAGLNAALDEAAGELRLWLAQPEASAITARVLSSSVGISDDSLGAALPAMLSVAIADGDGVITSLPIPQLLGIRGRAVEISRPGGVPCIFVSLPATEGAGPGLEE